MVLKVIRYEGMVNFICPFCGYEISKERLMINYFNIIHLEELKDKILILIFKCVCGKHFMRKPLYIDSSGNLTNFNFMILEDSAVNGDLIEEKFFINIIRLQKETPSMVEYKEIKNKLF